MVVDLNDIRALCIVFIVAWQKFYEFLGNATGIYDFNILNLWITDTLFCEVSYAYCVLLYH